MVSAYMWSHYFPGDGVEGGQPPEEKHWGMGFFRELFILNIVAYILYSFVTMIGVT